MQLTVEKIILWPKNQARSPRTVDFVIDRVNIITGQSGTGKSALISILDYALGSGKCAIPIGRIRDTTEWFGVMLRLQRGFLTIARRNPGAAVQSGDAGLVESAEPVVPGSVSQNVNVQDVVAHLNRLAGLPELDFKGGATESSYDARPSFRDMAAFNYQPQHVIANPYTLFFKADTEQHRRKLANVLPFVLGAVNSDDLVARRRLADLEREIRRVQDEYDLRQMTVGQMFDVLRSDFARARELGIIDRRTVPGPRWQLQDFAAALENGVRHAQDRELVVPSEGGTESAVDELVQIRVQEQDVARDLSRGRTKLARLQNLGRTATAYGGELQGGSGRLEGLGWFRARLSAAAACPLCGSQNESATNELRALELIADETSRLTARMANAPAVLDKEIETTRTRVRGLERALIAIREREKALADVSAKSSERRQMLLEVYRFLGSVEQRLANYRAVDKGAGVTEQLGSLQTERSSLLHKLDARGQRERERSALERVSRIIGHYTSVLELERRDEPASLSVSNLAVRVGGDGSREDFLWEIGSGENWVGYHIATLLSLHEFFLSKPDSPVPSFLMVDQPSQVYFPERWPGDPGGEQAGEGRQREPKLEDKDISGVRRIFGALCSAVERTQGRLQVIVTDHAGPITWHGLDVNVVEEWRTGRSEFLIPEDW